MGQALSFCKECVCPTDCDACQELHDWIMEALEEKAALQAYRGTGLEPEDVRRLQVDWTSLIMTLDEMGGMPHLRDLLQAEKDGRLVVLPVPVGTGKIVYMVYEADNGERRIRTIECDRLDSLEIWDNPAREIVIEADGWKIGASDVGKTVFLTYEDAEAAMKVGDMG